MSLPEPGSPADWLRHARSDFILAESAPPSGVLLEALCFHAQQATEKALKGVLIHFGVEPPYIHNIARLLVLLEPYQTVPGDVKAAAVLTPYAAFNRYPGDAVIIKPETWQEAVTHARAALEWAEALIGREGKR